MRWIGPAALGLGLVVLSPAADAERRVSGMILDADGRPLAGVLVEAFDSDAFPHGDAFPPWPAGDEHDLMGRDITNAAGQYRISYPRPHGAGPGGGYWDGTISHGLTRWRPDIYIKVKVPSEGFCVPTPAASAANTHRWRFVDESSVTVDWRTRLDLPLILKVSEFFDRSCGDFEPIREHMTAAGELRGFVDMHTHPMAHLGFGARLFHGAPDIGSLVPAGMFNCNATRFRATRIVEALSHCDAAHGGPNFAVGTSAYNPCGDLIRHEVVKQTEGGLDAQSAHGRQSRGYSYFGTWPHRNDISHQFMWIDWVERAYRGGLRVLVALAVNNETLTRAVTGSGSMPVPFHDGENARLQIEELKQLVARHSFMEIAYSPSDLRDIAGRNKLAVVLGIEVDDFMDLAGNQVPSASAVVDNIRGWHEQGVRYMFPVHVTDNAFGGTAVYDDLFAIANRLQFGRWWDLECAGGAAGISYRYEPFEIPASVEDALSGSVLEDVGLKALAAVKLGLHPADFQPVPTAASCPGHRNARGLQPAGHVALREMMKLGMIIDIDHMSEYTANEALTVAEAFNYPLNSGHSGLRTRTAIRSENAHTPAQYRRLARLGGMAGVGWSGRTPCELLAGLEAVRDAGDGIGLAFGTDANGLVVAPVVEGRDRASDPDLANAACISRDRSAANDLTYSDSGFPMARTGRKKFNYNTEGVAHYGLTADFVVHLDRLDTEDTVEHLFGGAESFARMWERADLMRDRWPGIVAATVL